MRRFAPPASIFFILLFGSSAPASAWLQTTTCIDEDPGVPTQTPYCEGDEFPKGFHWPDPNVTYALNRHGSEDVSDGPQASDRLIQVVRTSFDTWNEPDCSVFQFEYGGLTDTREFINDDGENVVVFHDDEWPYSSMALAITSVTADDEGVIVNADMEVNGVDHVFATGDDIEDRWDIQNTVTHEAGHMLGLDHSKVEESTMAFEAFPGETRKRDLHPDDVEGLCTIYDPEKYEEAENDPGQGGGSGCCATTSNDDAAPGWLALTVLLVTCVRRRSPR